MNRKLVAVAMSGGVDSSVAAYLLKKEGYEVIGINMLIFQESDEHQILSQKKDVSTVASILDIPLYTIDFRKEFEKLVIEPFCFEYLKGRTPNPCILCNEKVKFGLLLQKAEELGASFLATGHYARVEYDKEKKRFLLKKGIDNLRDQSYMLFSLKQEQLAKILFPLGTYTKSQVRKVSQEANLPVYDKPESQEICFILNNNYASFLENWAKKRNIKLSPPGDIVDTSGNLLGKHKGIYHYTIGQRERLGIAIGKPLYVVSINPENNQLVVGSEEEVYSQETIVTDTNWIAVEKLCEPVSTIVKIRYKHEGAPATIFPLEKSEKVLVRFNVAQRAVTPGQAAVFYQNDTVLGGGWITNKKSVQL